MNLLQLIRQPWNPDPAPAGGATDAPAAAAPAAAAPAPAADAPASLVTPEPAAADPAKAEGDPPKPVDGDGEGDKTDADKPTGAPETYADFTMPEFAQQNVDAEALEAFKALAKEANLPQEVAQKFLDLHVKMLGTPEEADQFVLDQVKTLGTQWEKDTRALPDLGGANFDASLALVRKACTQYATPELVELLQFSGFGNHPEMFRMFAKIGKDLTDAKIHGSGTSQPVETPIEKVFYPNMA